MTAQGRYALTQLRVPDLDGLVIASTCYVLPVWGPCNGADTAVLDGMIQHTKQLRQGGKIRWKKEKKSLTNLSALSGSSEQNRWMHRTPLPHSPLHVPASIRLVSNRLRALLTGPDVCFDRDASLVC